MCSSCCGLRPRRLGAGSQSARVSSQPLPAAMEALRRLVWPPPLPPLLWLLLPPMERRRWLWELVRQCTTRVGRESEPTTHQPRW